MARRSYYGTKRRTSSRRIVLYIAVVVVVAFAGKKLYDERTTTSDNGGDPEIFSPVENDSANRSQPVAPRNTTPKPVTTAANHSNDVVKPEPVKPDNTQPEVVEQQPKPVTSLYDPQYAEALKKMASGKTAFDADDVIKARNLLSEAVTSGLPWDKEKEARGMLNDLAKRWLFSKNMYEDDPHCVRYRVQSGDYLTTIGKNFKIPYQFIMRLNNISRPENLRANENLKVVNGPFHVVVDRTKMILTMYLADTICYTWPISTGREGRATPTGKWMVTQGKKLMNPEWTDPDTGKKYLPDDPDNPLGERWIGIHGVDGDAVGRTGFGIHGTIEPEMIGKPASRGCIRMRNQDVEVVYDMLYGGQSTVIIKD